MNKDKNQLMSFVQELSFLAGAIAGVGVTAGPDTGTITGSITALPNGLAHVTVDVVGMTVQLLHTALGVMQCVTIGVTHCEVDGVVHVHVLHTAADVSHMHVADEGVVSHMDDVITVGDVLHMDEVGAQKLCHVLALPLDKTLRILTIALYTTPIIIFNLM